MYMYIHVLSLISPDEQFREVRRIPEFVKMDKWKSRGPIFTMMMNTRNILKVTSRIFLTSNHTHKITLILYLLFCISLDEEIGGRKGMGEFVKMDDFKSMNVGFALDEGTHISLF